MNSLLAEVDESKRIVTVEDTPEFQIRNPNRMHIHMERAEGDEQITPKDVVDVVVRATPDGPSDRRNQHHQTPPWHSNSWRRATSTT